MLCPGVIQNAHDAFIRKREAIEQSSIRKLSWTHGRPEEIANAVVWMCSYQFFVILASLMVAMHDKYLLI
jgi:NADP-dependent 3-hydroxy acid dehydrogenase YdfG